MIAVRSVVSQEEAATEFPRVLARSGLQAALSSLLSQTGYRCLGIFRIDDGGVRSIVAVDRGGHAGAGGTGSWPEEVGRSCFVHDAQGRLVQAGALAEPEPPSPSDDGHAAMDCRAVPIIDCEGGILGTLCLYDRLPQATKPVGLELLVGVAGALAQTESLRTLPRQR